MKVGLDIDGTITDDPDMFSAFAQTVIDSGGTVYIVHGISMTDAVTPDDYQTARGVLTDSGFNADPVILYCAPDPIPANKAAYCAANGIDLLVDNDKSNCVAAVGAGVAGLHYLQQNKTGA